MCIRCTYLNLPFQPATPPFALLSSSGVGTGAHHDSPYTHAPKRSPNCRRLCGAIKDIETVSSLSVSHTPKCSSTQHGNNLLHSFLTVRSIDSSGMAVQVQFAKHNELRQNISSLRNASYSFRLLHTIFFLKKKYCHLKCQHVTGTPSKKKKEVPSLCFTISLIINSFTCQGKEGPPITLAVQQTSLYLALKNR